ncbi:MAG: hypothetical protein AAF367_09200 [Pseudomonadota bacterium]
MNEMRPPAGPAFAPVHKELDEAEATGPRRRQETRRQAARFWKWLSLALPDASSVMFRQKISGLQVAKYFETNDAGDIDDDALRKRLSALETRSRMREHRGEWSIANEMELLMVGLMNRHETEVELRRQLTDAHALNLTGVAEYERQVEAANGDLAILRPLLFRLTSDVQGRFRKRYLLREYVAAYTARVSLIFSISTIFFITMMIGLALKAQGHIQEVVFFNTDTIGPPMLPLPDVMRSFSSFYIALIAGLFGAAFSMMSQTKKRVEQSTLEDMRANARFAMLVFRLGVGIGAAVILYFIFDTQILGESVIMPSLTKVGFDVSTDTTALFTAIGALSPNRDLSLLMLWSFVAGFSEVLVPSILRQTESTAINT